MKSTKATIAMAAAMLLASVPVMQAQRTSPHELSVNFQGLGFGSMPFHGDETWSDHPGLSLGFSVGYTYWFNEHVGFRTGLRMNRLSHNQEIKDLDMPFSQQLTATSLGLPGGSALTTVDFVARAASVQEEWQYTFVELPLQLALEYSNVYFNVGLSLSKAVQATGNYSYDNPSCDIVGLPDYGIDMSATPVPVALSGETERDIKNRDMEKPFYLLLDAEVGYNFPVGECTSVGVGLFARYAPVRHKTDNDGAAYTVNATTPPNFNVAQPSKTAMADKAGYYEVGLSLGVNFGFCKSRKDAAGPSYVLAPRDEKSEAELAALKAAREKAEAELAAMKAAREKAEAEMAAMKAERDKAEAERLAAEKAAREQAERTAGQSRSTEKTRSHRRHRLLRQRGHQGPVRREDRRRHPRHLRRHEGRPEPQGHRLRPHRQHRLLQGEHEIRQAARPGPEGLHGETRRPRQEHHVREQGSQRARRRQQDQGRPRQEPPRHRGTEVKLFLTYPQPRGARKDAPGLFPTPPVSRPNDIGQTR